MSEERKHDDRFPPPNRVEPAENATPYELAPEPEPVPVPEAPPTQATPPPPAPAEPKAGKLSDSGLIDDFDDDADFDKDPEVERVMKGEPDEAAEAAGPAIDPERRKHRLVKPAGDPQVYAMIGGGIAIAAAIISGYNNQEHWFLSGVLALYMCLFNTITGVGAIGAVAYFEQARLGKVKHAAPRMLITVAAGSLVLSIGVGGYNVITAPLGIATYLGLLAVLYRWPPVRVLRVAALHAAIMGAQYFAMLLYAWAVGA
ncbi:MAG TPA: hypothetical protein VD997_14250 [Phycisphaerales bacterium]|nr:hypothetical protein [Phycisphaerales bacterium]